jgi:uncharacterized protein
LVFDVTKIYRLSGGANLMEEIARLAKKENIREAAVDGIGTVNELKLSPSEDLAGKGEALEFMEQMEVTTLLGNVKMEGGRPVVHVHGTFSRRDMSVVGGHVISATVYPMFELMITPTKK